MILKFPLIINYNSQVCGENYIKVCAPLACYSIKLTQIQGYKIPRDDRHTVPLCSVYY